MALNEVSFYNIYGEEINITNIVNQMINYYKMKYEVGETIITDFNEGSEIRNILEAFAIGIYSLLEEDYENTRIAFISTSYGVWLDQIGELPFIDLPRLEGTTATGTVTFTLETEQDTEIIIPSETLIQDPVNEIAFETLSVLSIPAGEITGDVLCQAVTEGADGNVSAYSITEILDEEINTDLITVSNAEDFVGGTDYETDEEYRVRLLNNVRADGFGTIGHYRRLCENIDGVHDVKFINDEHYTRKVLINGFTKPTQDKVLLDVLTVLTNIDNKVLNHNFTVDKPNYQTVNLDITVSVKTRLEDSQLNECIQYCFDGGDANHMSYTGLNIDEILTRERLINVLLVFDDVLEVTSIKSDNVEITSLTPVVNSVFKLGNLNITQNEV